MNAVLLVAVLPFCNSAVGMFNANNVLGARQMQTIEMTVKQPVYMIRLLFGW